jgi:RNA polymerase sigma factor (TIGR02999 family)
MTDSGGAPGVTELLVAWRRGDDRAFEALVPVVYPELRRLARQHLRRERAQTLQTTALAHEAYLRLVNTRDVHWRDRAHFFAMSSRIMRRVLVDAARARRAAKRGGGLTIRVTFDEALGRADEKGLDLVALDDALLALAALDERKARVVELRVFGGLTLAEAAAALHVSPDTIARDWTFVKSWLKRELAGGPR